MKILILTSRFPYPIEKGDKLRIYHQIKELSKQNEIVLCSLVEAPLKSKDIDELKKYCAEIYTFNLSKLVISLNVFRSFFNKLPIQVGYFYRKSIKQKIHNIVEKEKPDHIYVQLIRMTEYAKELDIPKTLDYMDAFSINTKRRASQSRGIVRQMWEWEAKRVNEYERLIYSKFDNRTIISEQDRNLLPITTKIAVIPNGVDQTYFKPNNSPDKKYDLVFVGNMGYRPNVEAVKYLAKQVFPIIQQKHPAVKLLIAGARPTSEVRRLANNQIEVSGWIEDIRDAYNDARIFVAPLFIGAGLQNKILEAMCMGLPCVTTNLVNNAIGAIPDKEILIANDAQEFANCIQSLLEDQDFEKKIRKKGKIFVENNFSWTTFVTQLEHIFTT